MASHVSPLAVVNYPTLHLRQGLSFYSCTYDPSGAPVPHQIGLEIPSESELVFFDGIMRCAVLIACLLRDRSTKMVQ